jgi:hypothetical protein
MPYHRSNKQLHPSQMIFVFDNIFLQQDTLLYKKNLLPKKQPKKEEYYMIVKLL